MNLWSATEGLGASASFRVGRLSASQTSLARLASKGGSISSPTGGDKAGSPLSDHPQRSRGSETGL